MTQFAGRQFIRCPKCGGTGVETNQTPKYEKCPHCKGHGETTLNTGSMIKLVHCKMCSATGKILKNVCSKCEGTGKVLKEQESIAWGD